MSRADTPYSPTSRGAPPPAARPVRRGRRLRARLALLPLLGLLAGTAVTLQPAAARPVAAPVAPENLLANPGFEEQDGEGFPTCWQPAGWGENTPAYASVDTAHSGAAALRLTVGDWAEGDAKIMVRESAECAPAVTEGAQYDLSVWYTSTTDQTVFTAFRHDRDQGWVYWTDLRTLPAADAWASAEVRTPRIPPGTDRISWGVTLFGGDGELTLDDAAMTEADVPAPPQPCQPGEPCPQGSWEVQQMDARARAMHFVQLHTGQVLMIAGSGNDPDRFDAGTFTTHLYDPDTGAMTEVDTPADLFCAGHVQLADGRVLVLGGTAEYDDPQGLEGYKGLRDSYVFDPETLEYTQLNDMNAGHWYPSATLLGNGDVLALGGLDEKSEGTVTLEYFSDRQQRWLGLDETHQTWDFWGLYPSMILLQDGRLFYSGSHVFGDGLPGTGASLYDYATGTITDVPGLRRKDERDQSMSVLLPPAQDQRVAIFGGGNVNTNPDAHRLTDLVDLSVPEPAYVPGADLPQGHHEDGTAQTGEQGKMYLSTVILPDGTVLETGGGLHNRADAIHETSIYHPATDTFTQVAPDPEPRGYHSGSLLLPDGRVLSYGNNPGDGSYDTTLSLYSPPYLSAGPRPEITGLAATEWTYGTEQRVTVDSEHPISGAALIRPEAVTHSSDPNQRYVDLPLTVDPENPDTLAVHLTGNPNLAPPGWYMLFLTDSEGVPSVARWVHLQGAEDAAVRVLPDSVPAGAHHPPGAPHTAPSTPGEPTPPAHPMPASANGCAPGYGEPGQCLPLTFPAGVDGPAERCGWLDERGWQPPRVYGRDRLELDTNGDGLACGRGDRGGPIG